MRLRGAQTAAIRKETFARAFLERVSAGKGRAAYDPTTSTIHAQDAVGRRRHIRLDDAGALAELRTASGRSTKFLNDADGRLLGVQESSGQQTTFLHGPDAQLNGIARNGQQLFGIEWGEGRARCKLSYWDGSTLQADYMPSGKPLQLKDRLNGVNVFNYDDDGEFLTEFINPRGESTRFEYNTEGRPETTIHGDGRRESVLGYDGMGNPVEVAHNGELTFTASYCAPKCPTAVKYSDGSELQFVRDDKNRMVEAIGPSSHTTFAHDEQGLPIEETTNGETFRMQYDATGLLTAVEYPDGTRVSFVYDEDKRLISCWDWTGRTTQFAYDGDRAVTMHTPNRLTERVSLHQNGKPERILLSEGTQQSIVADTRFEYDLEQRLTARSEYGRERQHYVYDAESQLTGVYVGRQWLENYYYDPAGNRAASHLGPTFVESGNRVTRQGADTYEYDARGNVIASTTDGQQWTFDYDLKNQMVAAHGPAGTVRFEYDALGRRISKTSDAQQVRYLWCGEQVTREIITTDQGVRTRDYLYHPSTYKPLAMRIDGKCYFFHTDHMGTPDRLSDASGQIVWSARYEGFGKAHIDTALIDNPLRFQGQYYDEETGLHYNRFRYYSPQLGRYWSVDPIGLVGGPNLYAYVGNDPVNRTDPLGLWWEAAVAIGAGIATAAAAVAIVATAPISLPVLAIGAIAVAAGAGVGLGVYEGITEYQETGQFCAWCFVKGVGMGIAFGLGAAALIAGAAYLGTTAAIIATVAVVGYGLYSVGDMIFNWDDMTHEERMEAAGSLLGGAIVGIGEAVVGPRVRAAWAGRRGVTEGEPAGSQSPKPRHEENIGRDLTPEERARIMDERTRQIAEEDAAVTREGRARREARDAERAADKEAIAEATKEKQARIDRLNELKKDPNATPEEIKQAGRDIGEAQKQESALKDDYDARERARQEAAQDDPPNHNGKVYEPALDKDTGDLYVDNQGNTPAQSISRPAESLDPSTAPGHCAMPRAADVARSRAAEQGRPPPNLETTDGGYTIRDGQVEPIDACGNCKAIKSLPENQIETLPNTNTSPPMTVPPPDQSTDSDDYYEDYE